jgi:hypothetical protein
MPGDNLRTSINHLGMGQILGLTRSTDHAVDLGEDMVKRSLLCGTAIAQGVCHDVRR